MLGNVVRYNFLSLDDATYETSYFDYAIVIDDSGAKVKILPITKEFGKDSIELFSLGEIPGLVEVKNEGFVNNKQYIHFDKMMDVDRHCISRVRKQDTYGNFIDEENVFAELTPEQYEKVIKKYDIYESGEEKNILNLLMKSEAEFQLNPDKSVIPENRESIRKEMDMYREYDFDNHKIIVFFVDGNRYSAVLEKTGDNDIEKRNNILKNQLN